MEWYYTWCTCHVWCHDSNMMDISITPDVSIVINHLMRMAKWFKTCLTQIIIWTHQTTKPLLCLTHIHTTPITTMGDSSAHTRTCCCGTAQCLLIPHHIQLCIGNRLGDVIIHKVLLGVVCASIVLYGVDEPHSKAITIVFSVWYLRRRMWSLSAV